MRECVICGGRFKPQVDRQITCGPTCSFKRHKQKLEELAEKRRQQKTPRVIRCVVCQTEFAPQSSNHRYCKPECRVEGLRQAIERQRQKRLEERLEKDSPR